MGFLASRLGSRKMYNMPSISASISVPIKISTSSTLGCGDCQNTQSETRNNGARLFDGVSLVIKIDMQMQLE